MVRVEWNGVEWSERRGLEGEAAFFRERNSDIEVRKELH